MEIFFNAYLLSKQLIFFSKSSKYCIYLIYFIINIHICFLFTVLFLFSAPLLTGQKSINTLKRIKYENEIDIFFISPCLSILCL